MWTRGRGQKSRKVCRHHNWKLPYRSECGRYVSAVCTMMSGDGQGGGGNNLLRHAFLRCTSFCTARPSVRCPSLTVCAAAVSAMSRIESEISSLDRHSPSSRRARMERRKAPLLHHTKSSFLHPKLRQLAYFIDEPHQTRQRKDVTIITMRC